MRFALFTVAVLLMINAAIAKPKIPPSPKPTPSKSTTNPPAPTQQAASKSNTKTTVTDAGVKLVTGAQLDIVPSLQLTEGERVTIRCSGIYPFGVNASSFVQIFFNETIGKRNVRWQLQSDTLKENNWKTEKKVKRVVKMDALYTLQVEMVAKANHNGMQIQCTSDDEANNIIKMEMAVKNTPKILDCFSNPQRVTAGKAIKVSCTMLEGNPGGTSPTIKAPGASIVPKEATKTFTSTSAFGQMMSRYEWTLRPRSSSEVLMVAVSAVNKIGVNRIAFALQPTAPPKRRVVMGKLVILPADGATLHVEDLITCRITNGSDADLRIMGRLPNAFLPGQMELASVKSDEVSYRLEAKFENQLLEIWCAAGDRIKPQLETSRRKNMIYAKNHRVFLDVDSGTSVRVSQPVNINCYFLPAKDLVHELTISFTTKRRKFALNFNGSGDGNIISNDFGSRVKKVDCSNDSDLLRCRVAIVNLAAEDFGATISCLMKNGFRTDVIQKRLKLQVPPQAIILSPRVIDVKEGTELESRCLIRLGSPKATRVSFDFEGSSVRRAVVMKYAIMQDMNGLEWQLLSVRQNLTIENAGRNLTCRAESLASDDTATLPVNMQIPMRNFQIYPKMGSTVTRGTEIRCSAEGYPKPKLTMKIGYPRTSQLGDYYFARVFGSKPTPRGGEISYTVLSQLNADIIVICEAVQALSSPKQLRYTFKRGQE